MGFEVYPQFSDDTTHPTAVYDEAEYLPGGEITVGHGSCEACDWTAKGDPGDTRDAAAAHEREHPKPTGEYGWRYRDANGQITAIGGEGFTRSEDAERAVRSHAEDVCRELKLSGQTYDLLEVKHVED